MAEEYSLETCRRLADAFRRQRVCRPMRVGRYDPGEELSYEVTGVAPARSGRVRLGVERFVGGGFAGQVYRVNVLSADGGPIGGLGVGGAYALKILLPPSGFARKFRDAIYGVGFQGPFSLQSNPDAVRAGAIWQKLIRRAAGIRFGDERAVVDVLATLYDARLGSYGEISEWIDGRTWRFEVDDRLDDRRRWLAGKPVPPERLGSPEYRAKREFMAEMVELMHEMGAHELARQYEWWTCKSQPNVLKRLDAESDPAAGLTAVDFRAGLALLCVLPMSPGDVKLIARGVARGSLVQFDRGDLGALRRFVDARAADFADLADAVTELEAAEKAYRDSLPDVTHHHVRLLYSGRLWATVFGANLNSLQSRNVIDDRSAGRLRRSRFLAAMFALLGVLPFLGRRLQRLLGRGDYRRHYWGLLEGADYFRRAVSAHIAEKLIAWHRAGRIDAGHVHALLRRPWRERVCLFGLHAMLSVLPAKLHRFGTDRAYARAKLAYLVARPVRLYFNAAAREQWLRDMVAEGERNGMLSPDEAQRICSQIPEPFIQKYLKSLAVHVCTLPVTQIVSVALMLYFGLRYGRWVLGAGIVVAFQFTPISPGSIVRGLYVLYLVARERNFKDYNIAVFLGFFKYVGYLAFPVQMAYRYPALARFMAGHAATGGAHLVPVFGERGALLEHGVFDLFYNRLLTLRRRFGESEQARAGVPPRRWHVGVCLLALAGTFAFADALILHFRGHVPSLLELWWLVLTLPPLAGAAAAAWGRGAPVARRIRFGAVAGAVGGLLYGLANLSAGLHAAGGASADGFRAILRTYVGPVLWPVLLFPLLAALGAFVAETRLEKPD